MRRLLARVYWPLAVLVALALAVRYYLRTVYAPMAATMADSMAYLGMARDDLWQDPGRNSGYPLFLRLVHAMSDSPTVTIGVQHVLGVATGLLAFATARRLGVSRPLSLLPAALVLLSGDQILLEHTLLTESLFTLLLVAGLYAAVRAVGAAGRAAVLWAATSGVALGAAFGVRTAVMFLLPVVVVWAALATPGPLRRRAATTGALALGMLLVVGTYLGAQNAAVGTWQASRAPGWALYARVAAIADCGRFTPPAGTAGLCETTPVAQRNGPDYYGWVGGPARRVYGQSPAGGPQLSAFARAVVLAQPVDYARMVGEDFLRYFVPPWWHVRPYGGVGDELTDIDRRAPGLEEQVNQALASWYEPRVQDVDTPALRRLATLQDVFRVHPGVLLAMTVLGSVALVVCRGARRAGAALMMATTLLLLLVPVATAIFSQRYAVPVAAPVGVAAALGLSVIAERIRALRSRRSQTAPAATGAA